MTQISYLPATREAIQIQNSEEGQMAIVAGEEVTVYDTTFEVSLIQPGTVKKKPELKALKGHFYFPDIELDSERLRLLPIAQLGYGRRLWPDFDSGETDLLCYSNDGMVPSPKIVHPQSEQCSIRGADGYLQPACPKAEWIDGQKAQCRSVLTIVLFDLDFKIPVKLQLSGKGISAWNKFRRESKKQRDIARFKKQKLSNHILELTTDDEGTYYEYKFNYVACDDITPADYIPLLHHYADRFMLAEETNAPGEQKTDPVKDTPAQSPETRAADAENEAKSQGFEF